MKKWHWSIGNNTGADKQDLPRALKYLGVGIHGVSEEWCNATGRGRHRKGMFDKFKDTARPGDEIYLFCKGKLRAKGIFTGEIFPISNIERNWLAPTGGWTQQETETLPQGSYKAMVESWETFSHPREGGGLRGTLYEITSCSKNYHNYH